MGMLSVIKLCLRSRLELTLLAICSDLIVTDHNAEAYRNQIQWINYREDEYSIFDYVVLIMAKPFTRWDAQYFVEIAHENGYPQEQMLAFFPLFPTLIRNLAIVFQMFVGLFSLQITLLSSIYFVAYFMNLFYFLMAALTLFKLSEYFFNSPKTSYQIVKFFAYNPASIFFTAYYTESLFCFLTFSGLFCLYSYKSPFLASILFGLSAGTRSNGVTNFGYIAFYQTTQLLIVLSASRSKSVFYRTLQVIKFLINFIFCLVTVTFPFILFQYYSYHKFCLDQPGKSSTIPEWCHNRIPLAYSAVQSKYWNVGFLRYYELKQIPNFIMAAPVLLLVFWSSIQYMILNLPYYTNEYLCFKTTRQQRMTIEPKLLTKFERNYPLLNKCCLPFVIHSLFMALFCLVSMHVQVGNRLLFSSNPWPYWALYQIVERSIMGSFTRMIVWTWFIVYFINGTIMFANFLPFT